MIPHAVGHMETLKKKKIEIRVASKTPALAPLHFEGDIVSKRFNFKIIII